MLLKQSTARNRAIFMVDAADHVSGKASLTLTITASKDGAAFASITPTVTDLGSGWYNLALTTTHTDTLGDLAVHITSTGADPTDLADHVVVSLPGSDTAGVTTLLSRIGAAITITSGKVDVNDKTGFSLSGAGVQAIWDALTSALTTVSSIGKLLVDNINATIGSRSTYAGGDTAGTTTLLSRIASALTISVGGAVDANVKQIDGQNTNGNNATLSLKQLNIVNNAGDALVASSTGGNGAGLKASGNGTGAGLAAAGGATGQGIDALGGATSGNGFSAAAVGSGDGIATTAVGAGKVGLRATILELLPAATVVTDAGNSATTFKTNRTETATDHWKDALLVFTTGALTGEVKKVSAYNGTSKIVTLSAAFTGTPAVGDAFLLVNR